MSRNSDIWVFGYGSLCWHPGFDFSDHVIGHVKGFSRKFWQGNTTHRGTPEKPGRVATLVEEEEAITHGVAFKLKDKASLDYLHHREVTLGGYVTQMTPFYPRDKSTHSFPIILYIATASNKNWLGPADLNEVAEQVVCCQGSSGHNAEYVLKLAEWISSEVPESFDDHLFTLAKLVKDKIVNQNLCLTTLMGERTSTFVQHRTDFDRRKNDLEGYNTNKVLNRGFTLKV